MWKAGAGVGEAAPQVMAVPKCCEPQASRCVPSKYATMLTFPFGNNVRAGGWVHGAQGVHQTVQLLRVMVRSGVLLLGGIKVLVTRGGCSGGGGGVGDGAGCGL